MPSVRNDAELGDYDSAVACGGFKSGQAVSQIIVASRITQSFPTVFSTTTKTDGQYRTRLFDRNVDIQLTKDIIK